MQIVVFVLRGCPVGWLGPYGNEWVVTPHLDRLASESIVFDRHMSDCPDPVAACRAWLGRDAALVTRLREAGIATALVRANHSHTDAPDWYYAGWGQVFDFRPHEGDDSPLDALNDGLPALLERLKERLDFLLWIEIDRLLPPWDVSRVVFEEYLRHELDEDAPSEEGSDDNGSPSGSREKSEDHRAESPEVVEPWRDPQVGPIDVNDTTAIAWLDTTFGSVVTMLDAELGKLFEQLRACGLDRSATWIVTSDLGYPLGEHGQVGLYRPWLHDELVHLPLIVRLPGAEEAGRRVPAFTQPADLGDGIRSLLMDRPGHAGGLLALARGEVETLRSQVISNLDFGPAAERAIRTPDWAYLVPVRVPEGETRQPMLFRKPEDRWEVNDLRARSIPIADELEAALKDDRPE